jgi:ketosteroid isomerase-like protein
MRAMVTISSWTARTRSSSTDRLIVVILEYEVHGNVVATGVSYDNRFISVVTIEDRKIVQWRDYMDSLTAMTALSALG